MPVSTQIWIPIKDPGTTVAGTGFGEPQGWANNTDVGLIKADHDMTLTLNLTNVEGTWSNYGITVFEGMDGAGGAVNHHASVETARLGRLPTHAPANASTPFGLNGLTHLAQRRHRRLRSTG